MLRINVAAKAARVDQKEMVLHLYLMLLLEKQQFICC
jgi:hypothetical protein